MPELNPERGLEKALQALTPAPSGLDRDRLMYRAGQLTSARRRWFWPAAAGAQAAAILVLLLWRPTPEVHVEKVYVEVPAKLPAPVVVAAEQKSSHPADQQAQPVSIARAEIPQPESAYLRLQEQVLRWGPDALPAPAPAKSPESHLPPITVERAAASGDLLSKTPDFSKLLRFFQ